MSDYDENTLITAMVGREVSALYPDQVRELGPAPAERARPAPDG
jgi:rhamnose transport system ATP-binding protein